MHRVRQLPSVAPRVLSQRTHAVEAADGARPLRAAARHELDLQRRRRAARVPVQQRQGIAHERNLARRAPVHTDDQPGRLRRRKALPRPRSQPPCLTALDGGGALRCRRRRRREGRRAHRHLARAQQRVRVQPLHESRRADQHGGRGEEGASLHVQLGGELGRRERHRIAPLPPQQRRVRVDAHRHASQRHALLPRQQRVPTVGEPTEDVHHLTRPRTTRRSHQPSQHRVRARRRHRRRRVRRMERRVRDRDIRQQRAERAGGRWRARYQHGHVVAKASD